MTSGTVAFQEFKEIDLRVGMITAVSDIEGYNKLYKLAVDIGDGCDVTLVAGIKKWYQKKDLVGYHVVVVCNLEKKEIAGVLSEGMLLAADAEGRPVLVMPCERVPPGTPVR